MLNMVKTALRVTTEAFDMEIQNYIDACIDEMQGLGVTAARQDSMDPQITTAVIAYCKWKFGQNAEADRWQRSYESMLGSLKMRSGYTDWGDV